MPTAFLFSAVCDVEFELRVKKFQLNEVGAIEGQTNFGLKYKNRAVNPHAVGLSPLRTFFII